MAAKVAISPAKEQRRATYEYQRESASSHHMRRAPVGVASIFLAAFAITSTASCGGEDSPPELSVTSGFDPCLDVPPSALNNWNVGPAEPAPSFESNGYSSRDPDLKSCNYEGNDGGTDQTLTRGDVLYVGLTRESFDYFHRKHGKGDPSRDIDINGRKVEIKGPHNASFTPGQHTTCDLYVQMNGGGLLLTSVKSVGDACQLLTEVAETIVPLLPSEI